MTIPIVLICGGSCSGKTTFANNFKQALIINMDNYYFGYSKMKPNKDGIYDFDVPESIDIEKCANDIKKISQGLVVNTPIFDMVTGERLNISNKIKANNNTKFVIVEGIFAFYPPLRDISSLNIFIDTPPEIRIARRLLRDSQKGRTQEEILKWSINVEKKHQEYIEPQKKYADLVIPFNSNPIKQD
jgi:uridine kinase